MGLTEPKIRKDIKMKELCMKYLEAKAMEARAKEERLAIEAALLAEFNPSKDEGTETKAVDGFKVSVTSKLNRVLDFEAYRALQLPENLAFVDLKPEINLKNLRILEKVDPSIVAACITTKPSKPTIKLEEVA